MLQLEILKDLAKRQRKVVLSMEMFEMDVQQVLDEPLLSSFRCYFDAFYGRNQLLRGVSGGFSRLEVDLDTYVHVVHQLQGFLEVRAAPRHTRRGYALGLPALEQLSRALQAVASS